MSNTNITLSAWRKSSHSNPDGDCVEVGFAPGMAGVRDTKDREGGTLAVSRDAWGKFLGALRRDELNA